MLKIELTENDPFERGCTYGRAAGEAVAVLIDVYEELFGQATGLNWQQLSDQVGTYLPAIKDYAPHLLTEIEGIAQGAKRPLTDILLLNCRSEVLFRQNQTPDECSSLAVIPPASAHGATLLAQNWDWYKAVNNAQVMLSVAPNADKPAFVTFTEAGQVAKIGMNSAGIGLVVNNLTCDQSRIGVPWLFVTRRVLESRHFAEAVGVVLQAQRAHAINYLLAHKDGVALDLETTPVEDHIIPPDQGLLLHTNHFVQPGRHFNDLKPKSDAFSTTYTRLLRLKQHLDPHHGDIDAQHIRAALRDHFDHPFSVCTHADKRQPRIEQGTTCLSVIMNLGEGSLEYLPGRPCRGNYIKWTAPWADDPGD